MDLCGSEWTQQDTALATQLEADLAAAGYDPLLTASEQQRLSMLLAPLGARRLEEGPPRPPHFVQMMRRVARRNSRRLTELHPDSASLKQLHAFVLSLDNSLGRQTVAAYRAALQAAEATSCELVCIGCGLVCICSWPDRMLAPQQVAAWSSCTNNWRAPSSLTAAHMLSAYAGHSIVFHLLYGAEGPTWPLAEVRSLLHQAERNFKRCKAWQFCDSWLPEELKRLKQDVAVAAAARPRSQRLPMTACLDHTVIAGGSQAPSCDACGLPSPKLRRCAGCESHRYWWALGA